jgi:outer membrane autotransporter protein
MAALNPSGALSRAEQQLFFRCREVLNATSESSNTKPEILQQLTSDELTAGQHATLTFGASQSANVAARLLVLRGGGATLASNGNLDWQNTVGGSAGDAPAFADGRIGIYLNGAVGSGDKDTTDYEAGYDVDTNSFTAGIDYRFSDGLVAGAAVGYGTSEADYVGGGGFESDGISGSLYASFYGERFYLNVLGSYGQMDHDLDRVISYALNCSPCTNQPTGAFSIDAVATGSTSSTIYSAGVDLGYELADGPFSFTPMASLTWVQVETDGFSEQNAGSANELALVYDDQTANSMEAQFGLSAAYNHSSAWGVISPFARIMVVRELRDSRQSFDTRYLFDPCFETNRCTAAVTDPQQTAFRVQSDRLDSSFYRWAVGAAATFANGFSAFAEYESLEDYEAVNYGVASIGLRYQFR